MQSPYFYAKMFACIVSVFEVKINSSFYFTAYSTKKFQVCLPWQQRLSRRQEEAESMSVLPFPKMSRCGHGEGR